MKLVIGALILLCGLSAHAEEDCSVATIYIKKSEASSEALTKVLDALAGAQLMDSIMISYPFDETVGFEVDTIKISTRADSLAGPAEAYVRGIFKPAVKSMIDGLRGTAGVYAACSTPGLSSF